MLKIGQRSVNGTISVTGTVAEVEAWKTRYYQEYHPCGYGTYEVRRQANGDGTVTVVIWRSHSCD